MMTLAPVMWMVWGVLVVAMAGLKIYSGRLTKDEDDHLILDSAFDRISNEQAQMMAKVHRIEPVEKTLMWLVVAMTVVVIGYYLTDFFSQFK